MIKVSKRPPEIPNVNPLFDALVKGDEEAMSALRKQDKNIPVWIPEFLENAEFLLKCVFKPAFSAASIYFSAAVFRRIIWGTICYKPLLLEDNLVDRLKPILNNALSASNKHPPIYLEFFMIKVFFEEFRGHRVNYRNCYTRIEDYAAKWIERDPQETVVDYLCDNASELVAAKFPQKQPVEETALPPMKKRKTQNLTPNLVAVDENPQIKENWLRLAKELDEGERITLLNGVTKSRGEILRKASQCGAKNPTTPIQP